MAEKKTWYVDSSVLLRAIVEQSAAARAWFENASAQGDTFIASRLMELEVRRVTKNAGIDQDTVTEYIDEFFLMSVSDELLAEAIALDERLGGADSIHVASALRLGPRALTIVTHDGQMAKASVNLGFEVLDPVTDDPNRGPVDRVPGSGMKGLERSASDEEIEAKVQAWLRRPNGKPGNRLRMPARG